MWRCQCFGRFWRRSSCPAPARSAATSSSRRRTCAATSARRRAAARRRGAHQNSTWSKPRQAKRSLRGLCRRKGAAAAAWGAAAPADAAAGAMARGAASLCRRGRPRASRAPRSPPALHVRLRVCTWDVYVRLGVVSQSAVVVKRQRVASTGAFSSQVSAREDRWRRALSTIHRRVLLFTAGSPRAVAAHALRASSASWPRRQRTEKSMPCAPLARILVRSPRKNSPCTPSAATTMRAAWP